MRNHKLISEEERIKCKKVIEIFEKIDAMPDEVIFADAGKYGFVVLLNPHTSEAEDLPFALSLEATGLFVDSKNLFDTIWDLKSFEMALDTGKENNVEDDNYEDIVSAMTENQKKRIEDLKEILWKEIFES